MAGGHDQLFKDLIAAFPGDFLRLLAPAIAKRLEARHYDAQPTEAFLDHPRGAARRPDIVLRAAARDGTEVLLHFEVELRFRSRLPARLWTYNRLLHLRSGLPVHTFLLCLRGGPPAASVGAHREVSLGEEICRFRYRSFGLSGASAERHLTRGAVAAALAALMRWPRGTTLAERQLACLRRLSHARGLNGAQRFLLFNCVGTYLQLTEATALGMVRDDREVRKLMMTWEEKVEARARKEGVKEGIREGMKELLLRQLKARFRSLPAKVRQRVGAMSTTEELTDLGERLATARSLAELGLH